MIAQFIGGSGEGKLMEITHAPPVVRAEFSRFVEVEQGLELHTFFENYRLVDLVDEVAFYAIDEAT